MAGVDQWWLCGPLGMTEAAVEVLTGLGVDRRRVHRELFYVDEPPPELHRADAEVPEGESSEVTVVLNGRSTTLTLPARRRPCSTARRRSAATCRSPARAACAAPAGPRSSTAR